jgi:hypothetical protein
MTEDPGAHPPERPATCDLREVASGAGHDCDGRDCVYWRVLEHVGEGDDRTTGCAIGHFDMLADRNPEVAVWLLSVKRRMDEIEGGTP